MIWEARTTGTETSSFVSLDRGEFDRWVVLHTKSRQEKAIARHLEAAKCQFYLPLVDRVTLVRGRKLRSRVPLFPGYVFLFGERDDAFDAVSTKRVCQILAVPDQARFEHELAQIAGALNKGAELDLYPFAVEGRRCRIIKGPFAGLEGTVVRRKSQTEIVLHVGILGRGAAMEIDADFLEPLNRDEIDVRNTSPHHAS